MLIKFHIYYSTHSGTSEGFADQISSELKKLNIDHDSANISDLTTDKFFDQNYFIFLISTHFDGESCKDGENFYQWIQKEKGKPNLQSKKFTLFGLGDNTFENFNLCSRTYYKYFRTYLMEEFYPYEIGSDHDGNIENDFKPWKSSLLSHIQNMVGNGEIQEPEIELEYIKGLNVTLKTLEDQELQSEQEKSINYAFTYKKYKKSNTAKILKVQKAFSFESDSNQSFYIKAELENEDAYQIAQNIQFYPQNIDENIHKALLYFKLQDFDQNIIIQTESKKSKAPFPSGTTIGEALKCFFDLKEFPKVSFFNEVSKTIEQDKRQKLQEFLMNQDQQKMLKRKHYGVIEVLQYLNIKLSFEKFCCLASPMKPRYFTIASYCKPNSKEVEVVLKKEIEKIGANRIWTGLFSSQMADLEQNFKPTSLRYQITESTFHVPTEPKSCLLIASGSGVAPMLSILEEKEKNPETVWKDLKLVFGIWNKEVDFLAKDFLNKQQDNQVLQQLVVVQSRVDKKYVQNYLRENPRLIEEQISSSEGGIYICGNLNMCNAVIGIIKLVLMDYYKLDEVTVSQKFKDLQNQKVICYEAWG